MGKQWKQCQTLFLGVQAKQTAKGSVFSHLCDFSVAVQTWEIENFLLNFGASCFNLGRLRSVMSIFCQKSLKMTLRVWDSKLEIWSSFSELISSCGSKVCKVIEFPVVAGELQVNFNYPRNLSQLALWISWIMMLSGLHRQTHHYLFQRDLGTVGGY